MSKKDEIRRLWKDTLSPRAEWLDMFFNRVYRDEDAMILERDGRVVSALLLKPYVFNYLGKAVSMGYIMGAATRRNARGNGYMSALFRDSLLEAQARGDMIVALKPRHEWLFDYFDRFGMSTVFYVDTERYTSLHSFATRDDSKYIPVDTSKNTDRLFHALNVLELEYPCGVVHSREEFETMLIDNALDGGDFVAVEDSEGDIAGMAWALVDDETVVVTCLMGERESGRRAALAELRNLHPGLPFKVLAPPSDEQAHRLTAKAMARVVNVETVLDAVAQSDPGFKCVVRVSDPLIQTNNGIWRVGGGEVIKDDSLTKTDLDVSVETFTSIIFSGKKIGSILRFPTARPRLGLML